jgi:hypothetical protein
MVYSEFYSLKEIQPCAQISACPECLRSEG